MDACGPEPLRDLPSWRAIQDFCLVFNAIGGPRRPPGGKDPPIAPPPKRGRARALQRDQTLAPDNPDPPIARKTKHTGKKRLPWLPGCVGIVNLAIPAHGGRPGAYSYSPRSDEPRARDLRGSTLRTGYCDRKIDVTDKRNSNSDILVRDVNFSESEISGIYGRDGPTTHTVRRL